MAKGIDKFLKYLKLTDEDDYDDDLYDDYDDDEESERELRKEEKRLQKEQRREEKKVSYRDDEYDDYDDAPSFSRRTSQKQSSNNKVVPIRSTSSGGFEVCIIKPSNFGDSQEVCDILLGGQPVVVNLEGIDILEAQRIMDFISGCIFSISGDMKQVSRYIFIFSPKNVDISGDYIQSMTEGGDGINIPTLNKEF